MGEVGGTGHGSVVGVFSRFPPKGQLIKIQLMNPFHQSGILHVKFQRLPALTCSVPGLVGACSG